MPLTSIIDNVNYPRYMNPHTQRHAYAFGGALYAILRDDVVNFNIRMYRSLDGGLTSVELDAANSPLFGSSAGFVFDGSTCHVFLKALGTNILTYIPFDLLAGTWGAAIPSAVNMGLGGFPIYAGVRSTGEIMVFYRRAGLPLSTECWYMPFNAGVFGAEVQVSGTPGEPVGTTKLANGLLVDPASDVVHFFYAYAGFFGNSWQYHRGMSAVNVLDARQDLYSVPSATTNGPITGVSTVDAAGVLCVPFNRYIGVGPVWHASVLYGTTAAMTSPVWTDETIDATEPVDNTGLIGGNTSTFSLVNAAGDLMVWWATVYLPYGTNKLLASTRVAGVWSAPPTPYYDLNIDANPDPAVANQFLHDISVVNLGGGAFGVLVSAEFGLNPATGLPYCASAWVLAIVTTLTINKAQVPPADLGRWNLQIGGVTVGTGANVGDGGTTGPIPIAPGLHQAGETPMPGTNPANYITAFSGDCAPDGSLLMGPSAEPHWVDYTLQPQGGENRRGSFWGPWQVGANLYAACDHYTGPTVPPNVLRIYKSVDFGVTWVEQNVANEPVMQADAICHVRDGNVLRTGRIRPVTLDVALRDFDFTTDTWGADYGIAGSPVIANLNWDGMLVLSNGTFRFFYSRFAGFRTIYFADYAAGVWTIDQPVYGAAGTTQSQPGLVYDSGLSHGFFSHEAPPGTWNYYHYSITDAGVVTIDGAPCYSDFTGNAIFNAIIVAGGLKVSHRAEIAGFYYPALLAGTPAAAPVWSTETVEPVDGTTAGVWVTEQAGEIRVWWGFSNFGNPFGPLDQFFYSIRGPMVWGAPVVYWDRLASPPVPDLDPPGWKWQYGPSIAVYSNGATFGGWYGVLITVDAPVGPMTPVYIVPGGDKVIVITNTRIPPAPAAPVANQGGFRRMVVLIPNKFDHALNRELQAHLANQPRRACCKPILWRDINWVRAPKDYIPFRKTAGIPTPLAIGDVEVLNFEVPPGYDGVIAGLFNVYTGPGFREGNGDIEWRLMVNRTYAIHLGRIMVSLGGQDQPYPVDGGIFVQSGTRVRYIVNVPNLSGGILPLASQIVCGLEGLFYART